jgi:hypothetical protein
MSETDPVSEPLYFEFRSMDKVQKASHSLSGLPHHKSTTGNVIWVTVHLRTRSLHAFTHQSERCVATKHSYMSGPICKRQRGFRLRQRFCPSASISADAALTCRPVRHLRQTHTRVCTFPTDSWPRTIRLQTRDLGSDLQAAKRDGHYIQSFCTRQARTACDQISQSKDD